MKESYAMVIREASAILTQAVLETESDLAERAREMDATVRELTREIGRQAVEAILETVSRELTQAAGLPVERRPVVCFGTVFGPVPVESPYLYDPTTRRSARPVKETMGITHRGRSPALERAIADFGAETSFGRAAERFEEHYGFSMSRTTMLRVTEAQAVEAERFVQARLAAERERFENPQEHPSVLVELDGSMIRTGTLQEEREPNRTLDREGRERPAKRKRVEEWREVRVGLARRLEESLPTYVAQMASYPQVVSSLFSAAVGQGLSPESPTLAVADGGNGLKEELELQFPHLTFILDRPHLQNHLSETAEAMGLTDRAREEWRRSQAERIDTGRVREVIAELRRYTGVGQKRVLQLTEYLHRFRDCVHYDAYKERGFPIGSGEVESAHRFIPQARLKLPGACWKPQTLNPMLALRILRPNGWWEAFWKAKNAA